MVDRATLLNLINKECLTVGSEFQLSTGAGSDFYFDCKKVTLDGKGLNLVTDLVLEEIEKLPQAPTAIGGLTIGADPIVAGVILKVPHLKGCIVRKERKNHGTRNKIENEVQRGTKIVVVDDVITTGGSTETACEEFKAAGYDIVGVIALIDREAGGLESLKEKYNHAIALFAKSEFPKLNARYDKQTQEPTAAYA